MEFENKVAVVTGAGAGIGKASAIAFAREGASVVVVDMSRDDGSQTVKEIEDNGGKAIFLRIDVSQSEEVQKIPQEARNAYGGIDILHNNAGIQRYGTAVTTAEEEWDHVIDVNLKSVFLCSKYCIPEMLKRGGGAIVNSSSVQGFACQANVAAYTVSKAGIIALTNSMAVDFALDNIRVNAVCPASVDTPMLRWATGILEKGRDMEDVIDDWGKNHPIGRIGRSDEIAEVVLFLASSRASFVTGAAYRVDGGYMSKL